MRRIRKTFSRPKRRWDKKAIEEERKLMKEYGLRRKKELWKAKEILRRFRQRARELIAVKDKEKEKALLEKLVKLGLLKPGQGLDDILALTVKDILERRLQTRVFRKGLANTPKQARQFIVHGHIYVDGRRTNIPSYLVPISEEEKITSRLKHG
ncbi:MAG: 30S ribosomal protein S4 [Candidatus Aenigmatarchaeota archaeon]|nr:MAG: 30S ribosomal protein S4 [Candidatus Aenigmarchaeota archaeon]